MANRKLLPAEHSRDTAWPAPEADHFLRLLANHVRDNLARLDNLRVEGVPSIWSRIHYINWALENTQVEPGSTTLRTVKTLVLFQFLGLIRRAPVVSNDAGFTNLIKLMQFFRRTLHQGDGQGLQIPLEQALVIWVAHRLPPFTDGEVIAGSLLPQLLIFPAANVSDERIREALSSKLQNDRRIARFVADDLQVRKPLFASALADYLEDFCQRGQGHTWSQPFAQWAEQLRQLGGNVPTEATAVSQNWIPNTDDPFGIWVDDEDVPPEQEGAWARSTILIWPPKEADNWHINYIVASTSVGGCYRVRFRARNQPMDSVSQVCDLDVVYRVPGTIRAVELGTRGTPGTFVPQRFLKVNRQRLQQPQQQHFTVALDFGTANSAVAYRAANQADGQPALLRDGLSYQDLATQGARITLDRARYQDLEQAVSLLLPWQVVERQPRDFVPTLLADLDPDVHPAAAAALEPNVTIPTRDQGVALVRVGNPRLVSDLKGKNFFGENNTGTNVKRYLETLLLPVMWQLRERGAASFTFKATYPLTWDLTRKRLFEDILNQVPQGNRSPGVLQSLPQLTGLNLTTAPGLPSVSLWSEAAAGAWFYRPHQPNCALRVTLDLGGGTLDIALLAGNKVPQELSWRLNEVIAADSLEYGTRALLHAILASYGVNLQHLEETRKLPPLSSTLSRAEYDKLADRYIEVFEDVLHSRGIRGLDELLAQLQNVGDYYVWQGKVTTRWDALFAAILVYVRNMLEGAFQELPEVKNVRPIKLHFFLLGQGWQLLPLYLGGNGDPRQLVAKHLIEMCKDIRPQGWTLEVDAQCVEYQIDRRDSLKTAVATGAIEIAAEQDGNNDITQGDMEHPHFSSIRVAKTFLGMQWGEDAPTTRLDKIAPIAQPQRTQFACQYAAVLDKLLDRIPRERRPTFSEASKASIVNTGEAAFESHGWSGNIMTRGPLNCFLSKVWKEIWSRESIPN